MILLDTTVLVYAVGDPDHPLAKPAQRIIAAARDGELRAQTTPEVIQEFAHVRARRRTPEDAVSLAHDYAMLLAPLRMVTPEHLTGGLSIWETTPRLGSFDALLAAVAISSDIELVSADRAFADIPSLRYRSLTDSL